MRARRRRALSALFALSALACGRSAERSESQPLPAPTRVETSHEEPASSAERPRSAVPSAAGAAPVGAAVPAAPERGCAFGEPRAVHAGGWSAVAAAPGAVVVAGTAHEGERERMFALGVGFDGTTRVLAEGALEHAVPPEHRRSGPALASSGERLAFVVLDGRRRVLLAELSAAAPGAAPSWTTVGEGASLRFAPAVAAVGGGWAVAWTGEEGEVMRVHGALVRRGAVEGVRELRSPAGGAAAPAFVVGAGAPTMLFVDPREGLSVIHRAAVSADGFGEPTIGRPVNLVAEPPALAAALVGEREWAAYTAIGLGATTAIGLVRLDSTEAAVAVVRGTGYGVLHVASAPLPGERALFVGDAPQEPAPTAPRELHARVLDRDGVLGEPAVVRGPSGAARRGRVAHVTDGVVGLSFTDGEQIHVALGRCGG